MALSISKRKNITSPISRLIENELSKRKMTWNQLVKKCGFQPNFATRVRRQGVIPTPIQASALASVLNIDWTIIWKECGHITDTQVRNVTPAHDTALYILTEDEASIIDAFRNTSNDAKDYLIAASRGCARASSHQIQGHVPNFRRSVTVALDFVNDPAWLKSTYGSEGTDSDVVLDYLGQAAIVGIIRYASTLKASPMLDEEAKKIIQENYSLFNPLTFKSRLTS
jgi:hypothetical protein|tara:strand:- start:5787 stop:6464 length:678 start_codon:yes stop_codon:yes gene_type:complete